MKNADRSRRGFTLVELLVVVSIILILISLLAPSVRQIVERAQFIHCRNNLRQIGIATAAYMAEHGSEFPGCWYWGRSYNGVAWSEERTITDGLLYPYMSEEKNAYLCPVFAKVYRVNPAYSHLTPKVGYVMNEAVRTSGSWQGCQIRRATIRYPCEQLIYAEENCFNTKYNPRFIINNLCLGWGTPNRPVDSIATFHMPPGGDIAEGSANAVFADLHAEEAHARDTYELCHPK